MDKKELRESLQSGKKMNIMDIRHALDDNGIESDHSGGRLSDEIEEIMDAVIYTNDEARRDFYDNIINNSAGLFED